jgi:hypothetical protein
MTTVFTLSAFTAVLRKDWGDGPSVIPEAGKDCHGKHAAICPERSM